MSVYVPNQREIEHEERLLADRAWQAERSALNDLLRGLDGARDDDAFFDVHVSLVARLKKRQELIADLRIRLASLKATRRELARSRPKPIADLKAIQLEIDEVDWDEEVQRNLHRLLLDVGDALVWRRLGLDRAAITVLGQGTRVAWLSDGAGWDAEMSAVAELWDDRILALMNDATTCLRLGDLTRFFTDRVEIREVKAQKPVAEDHPQQIRLRQAITLINESRATMAGTNQAVVRCPDPYQTYLGGLPPILDRARSDGIAVASPSRSQLVVATDVTHAPESPFDEFDARRAARWQEQDIIFRWGTSLRRMRDRHHSFAYFAPVALLPLDVATRVDLMLGQLDYTVWLNVSSVARVLRGRGLLATPFGPPESAEWFMVAGRRDRTNLTTVHIAPHVREIMALELVAPTYMAKLALSLLRALSDDQRLIDEKTIVVPGDESRVWLAH
jgi:hypothetical protein